MTAFRTVWSYLTSHLRANRKITIPGADGAESTTIVSIEPDAITVAPPRTKGFVRLPREDFELIWHHWADFQSGKITRSALRQLTTRSSYIITLLSWYDRQS